MNASSDNPMTSADKAAINPLNEEVGLPSPSRKSVMPDSSENIDLDNFFLMAIAQRVSDIHLRIGSPPLMRKEGLIVETKLPELTPKAMQRFAQWIIPDSVKPLVTKHHDLDFAVNFGDARLRVNMLYELGRLAFVIRVVPTRIPSLADLGLPRVLNKFTRIDSGLILVTGPAGSGKSTTLASLLNTINENYAKHIITLEDPVEFVHQNKRSVITQRQLGVDTTSFPAGIKYSLRQDPDVILIGEMRDRETTITAIKAAETGALIFSTLHTSDAVQTINRIIDFFEPYEREAVRLQLGNVLKGIVAQRLYHRPNNRGRAAVAEVMMVTPAVKDYLLRNQLDEIYALIEEGRIEGMQSMNSALYQLVKNNEIAAEEALRVSNNPLILHHRLQGGYHGTSTLMEE